MIKVETDPEIRPQGLSPGRLLELRYVTLTRVPLSRSSAEASPTPPAGEFRIRVEMNAEDTKNAVRIDKWLWAARLFKSRTLAGQACHGGKVDVNGQGAKPGKLVRPGDMVEVTLPSGRRILKLLALGERRGPANVARTLYEDLTPPAPPGPEPIPPPVRRPRGLGRPTKRERRQLSRIREW